MGYWGLKSALDILLFIWKYFKDKLLKLTTIYKKNNLWVVTNRKLTVVLWQQTFYYLHIGTDVGVKGMLFGLALIHNILISFKWMLIWFFSINV